ncbi:MAG: T9SS type A sorting domain-containing protein [Candidatus Zixiibacteriota bacterium]|nr:MAG: T9SS type A sorting domain-containing protein [candidate division Zixibacteria bacterium]
MIFYNNYADAGGAVMANHGNPLIDSCRFIDNIAESGGSMFFNNGSAPFIHRSLIHGNTASGGGGGLFAEVQVAATIVNCTFSDNSSLEGGGIDFRQGDLTIHNTIIGFSGQGGSVSFRGNNNITISYSDFYGNIGGDWFGPIADLLGVNGNISLDPMFVDHANGDCRLSGDSPCIDAGDPLSPYDPDSTIADMGAYYFDQLTNIINPSIPNNYFSVMNYPNPFNSTTTIRYHLTEPSRVSIDIYDLLGREIETLSQGYRPAGSHRTVWDPDRKPSGLYFYKVDAGGYSETGEMLYLR